MVKQFEIQSKELEKFGFASKEIHHKKLDKPLLISMRKGPKGQIFIFDKDNGDNEIACIQYTVNPRGVYVSKFVTNEEYQQNGLGRLIFSLAMAHGDALGVQEIYGPIDPTDPIKGVSSEEEDSFDKEKQTLEKIYSSLGCKVEDGKFSRIWKEKEILNNSSEEIKTFIEEVAGSENIK